MPAVATVDEFVSAAAEFPDERCTVPAETDAVRAAAQSLAEAGMVLVGEVHGVRQTPLLVRAMADRLGVRCIALEWPIELADTITRFLDTGRLDDHELLGFGAGRITAGHLSMLRAATTDGIGWRLFDGSSMHPEVPGESYWTARDRAMADRLLEQVGDEPCLVVAGGLHTLLERCGHGVPMGVWLARARPGLRAVIIRYGAGGYYNVGPRRFPSRDDLVPPGLHLADGQLVLGLPDPVEATVLHHPGSNYLSG